MDILTCMFNEQTCKMYCMRKILNHLFYVWRSKSTSMVILIKAVQHLDVVTGEENNIRPLSPSHLEAIAHITARWKRPSLETFS